MLGWDGMMMNKVAGGGEGVGEDWGMYGDVWIGYDEVYQIVR
jgi:hypothetical protein